QKINDLQSWNERGIHLRRINSGQMSSSIGVDSLILNLCLALTSARERRKQLWPTSNIATSTREPSGVNCDDHTAMNNRTRCSTGAWEMRWMVHGRWAI